MKSTAHFRPLAATLLLLALALAGPVSAATLTWNGGNGSWNDPAKWSPMQIPGAGDTAVIGGTDGLAIVLSGIRSVGTLVLNNPNATLQVVGQAGASATLTVANGFGNGGIIELTSVNTSGGATLLVSNGGTLTNAVGGVIRALVGTGGPRTLNAVIDNRGTLEAGADLTLTRNIANSGTVHLTEGRSATANSPITWTHQGGAITGTGTLSLGSGSTLALEADFTTGNYSFNATGLTVNGPGTLLGPPTGEFVIRQWTINAPMTVSGDLRVERNVAINGALAVSPGKTLRVMGINSVSATLTVASGFENRGIIELTSEGAVVAGAGLGTTLIVSNGGTLTNATSGVIRVLEGSGGTRTLNAVLDNRGTLEAGTDLALTKNVANSGTVHLTEGRSATANSPITWTHQGGAITGTGTLSLGSGSTLALEADFTTGNYSFNATGLTVNGPGTLLGPPTGEFVIRQWTINAPMTVSGDLRVERSVAINSALAVSPGRTLRVVGQVGAFATLTVANGFENRGIIELTSANTSGGATMAVTTGTLTNAVGGVIRALDGSGGTRVLNADLDNQGEISVLAGVTLTMNRTLLNAATGVLSGTGTFNLASATVTNKGAVAPGASPGRLSISGSYPWTAAAQLDLELGGFTAGTEHDQLALANAANLDGVIRVALINGFFPKKDDAFTVLTYPSRTGTFATLDNPLPKRIAWEVRYGPTSAQLVVLNTAPTLAAIPKQTLNELAQLSVTASATDQDLPAQIMTYMLETAPAGMTINSATGQITWTPTEAQGPGEFDVTVRVTDNGTPTLGHATGFKVTVSEVNVAPQLVLPAPVIADEQAELVFTVNGADADLPANALTYELVSGPVGATFNASTREFRWTPTETQGPGSFTATFRVTDNNPDAVNEKQLSSQAGVSIAVAEVNLQPTLADIAPQTVNEETLLTLTASATDLDLPANGLTYSLDAAPTGLTINPATGVISWTPTEAQGPGTFTVSVRVTDTSVDAVNAKSLSSTGDFQISVTEVNRAPISADLANATVHAGTPFTASLTATDPDLPANPFTFSLISSPTGMAVSPGGSVSWNVPLEAAGSLAEFTVRVTDAGSPAASSERRYQVNVAGPIVILGAAKSGDQLEITWRAVPGKRYRLIRAVTLPTLEWLPVPAEVVATGETASKTLSIDSTQDRSFFRVELVP